MKILGTNRQYYIQTNNAQVELFNRYYEKGKIIACGPTSAAMGFDIAGYPMDVFTPGEQPEDSILMVLNNPANLRLLINRRNLDYGHFPPNEVPQAYDIVGRLIWKKDACLFKWGLSFEIIKENIDKNIPMMIAGNFPCGAHYVLIVGYNEKEKIIIFNDPYPNQWEDKKGYNRKMDITFFEKNISKWRIDFFPYKA